MGLTGVINAFAGALSGGDALPSQVSEMVSAMSSSPLAGEYTDTINSQGTIEISWGLGFGSYMFIIAAAIKIVGGLIIRQTKVGEVEDNKLN